MGKDQRRITRIRPKTSKLTEEEIERVHRTFIETRGHTYRTAQLTGFARSTVSKYAEKNNWYEETQHSNNMESLDQETKREGRIYELLPLDNGRKREEQEKDEGNGRTAEQVMSKLKELRELMFEEIMGNEKTEAAGESLLKIPPRTLAEVVKALIDIDKRITERQGPQSDTVLDAYQRILIGCARIVEDRQT